jgi:hypothetical protein
MRISVWLSLTAALTSLACSSDSNGGNSGADGVSNKAVGDALTRAAKFKDGVAVDGLLPDATADGLALLTGEPVTAGPGQVTLMSFDAENAEQGADPVTALLLQFPEAEEHFLISLTDSEVTGTQVSATVELTLANDVCEKLCAKEFDVTLDVAAKRQGGGVGALGHRMLKLDCTTKGKPDLCGASNHAAEFVKYWADGSDWCDLKERCGTLARAECESTWPTEAGTLATIESAGLDKAYLSKCEGAVRALDKCVLPLSCEDFMLYNAGEAGAPCEALETDYDTLCKTIVDGEIVTAPDAGTSSFDGDAAL